MKPKQNNHNPRNQGRQSDDNMADTMDDLAEFEKFKANMLPVLRKDLESGLSAKDIYKKYAAIAAARTAQIAISEVDSGKALAASKEIMDRAEGKSKETVDHTHRMADLPEEQLDAMIRSKLKASGTAVDSDDEGANSGSDPSTLQ